MAGWIKLYRTLAEHDLWTGERFTRGQAWADLLMLANHKPGLITIRGIDVAIRRGQTARSKLTLAKRWRWSEGRVNNFLGMLERRGMVQTKTDNLTTLITIINYDLYQGDAEQNTEQRADQNTDQTQTKRRTNKNDKNDKNTYSGENILEKIKREKEEYMKRRESEDLSDEIKQFADSL